MNPLDIHDEEIYNSMCIHIPQKVVMCHQEF
jgi:hypothetical protein